MAAANEIKRLGIGVVTSARVAEISGAGALCEYVGDEFSPPKPCETLRRGMLESVVMIAAGKADAAPGEKTMYEADTVICALGQVPSHEEIDALRDCAPIFYELGDCVSPRNVCTANALAFTIARDLGRV
jgi:hypothetical protein